jgi:hypothetical protein
MVPFWGSTLEDENLGTRTKSLIMRRAATMCSVQELSLSSANEGCSEHDRVLDYRKVLAKGLSLLLE